jgi:hypothetical protein
MSSIKNRRLNLWKRNPHCYWCGKRLKWEKTTIDHLNSRVAGKKRPRINGVETTVLSCRPCNQSRAYAELNSLPRWRIWLHSKSFPKITRKDLSTLEKIIILYFTYIVCIKNDRELEMNR